MSPRDRYLFRDHLSVGETLDLSLLVQNSGVQDPDFGVQSGRI